MLTFLGGGRARGRGDARDVRRGPLGRQLRPRRGRGPRQGPPRHGGRRRAVVSRADPSLPGGARRRRAFAQANEQIRATAGRSERARTHPRSLFGCSSRWGFTWIKTGIRLRLVDLSRTPSGTFFGEVHPASRRGGSAPKRRGWRSVGRKESSSSSSSSSIAQ